MSYRKRDIGHWNQGKSYKGWRKAKEREHIKHEIHQQIDEQDDDFRYRHYSRTPNELASAKHSVEWYSATLESYKRSGRMANWCDFMRDGLRQAKKRLKELEDSHEQARPQ